MYTIAGIAVNDIGFVPGRAEGSNLALSGFMDMPKRGGKTFHSWGDEKGVEPYVSAAEIWHEGRDLSLTLFTLQADRQAALATVRALYDIIDAQQGLFTLGTAYGQYEVYMESETDTDYIGGGCAKIVLKLREPVVANIGSLPVGNETSKANIDGVSFESLGAFIERTEGQFTRPEAKEQQFTAFGREGYQVTKPEGLVINTQLVFYSQTMAELQANVKKLQKLLSQAGMRKLNVDGVDRPAFNTAGFAVTDIRVGGDMAVCRLSLPMMTTDGEVALSPSYIVDVNFNNIVTAALDRLRSN